MDEIISELKNRGIQSITLTFNPDHHHGHPIMIAATKHFLRQYLDGDFSLITNIEELDELVSQAQTVEE